VRARWTGISLGSRNSEYRDEFESPYVGERDQNLGGRSTGEPKIFVVTDTVAIAKRDDFNSAGSD
jgi:hypothetical protein